MDNRRELRVTIVGGGLVGTLEACLLANHGIRVDVFESREDMRKLEHVQGRSINLALSVRGRAALSAIGLEEKVITNHGIPMRARLIHEVGGRKRAIPYGKKDQCIYSVSRRFLNETLLTSAEKHPNVSLHFSHKLTNLDIDTGNATFKKNNGQEVKKTADLIIGCDGAYSTVRRQMLKQPLFNYSQTYIPHGYLELCIPPTEDGQFAMEVNYLHIWPRGKFMMIALPNQDKTYTVTLFAPFQVFDTLTNQESLIEFFSKYFPDAVTLIGQDKLVEDFFRVKPSPLVSIKCSPYHVKDKVVILGDAAHAMVPFYGQGLNAGLEDCLILNQFLENSTLNLESALRMYSEFRNPDAEAICDLAMYNYIEMRDLVNSSAFLLRKKFDYFLNLLLGDRWVPLYSMVTFSRTRYHLCIKNREWQDAVVNRLQMMGFSSVIIAAAGAIAFSFARSRGYTVFENSRIRFFGMVIPKIN